MPDKADEKTRREWLRHHYTEQIKAIITAMRKDKLILPGHKILTETVRCKNPYTEYTLTMAWWER